MNARVIWIENAPYRAKIPTGGNEYGLPNDWDHILDVLSARRAVDLVHVMEMYSICQESKVTFPEYRIHRGFFSSKFRNYGPADMRSDKVGFRPVLEPLDPETLQPAPDHLKKINNGKILEMGTLYMNGVPVSIPSDPTYRGDIRNYIPDADLYIGDSIDGFKIPFIKCGGLLVSDRVLLKNISWTDLQNQCFMGEDHC